ncbi:tetratricopeptide repeat protein [Spirochaeta africana]|uniref:Tetratricopeptide repeat protein n=1 Tax=Spirochaeta africana (strain ATCC 700263 / DSM 8902 / Z-7692) TaxID=889378 RepID=H9UKZ7_SPIAZ|nr:tetratricopeptide repeat protein [Spirochaeta africana]AFG38190.1 tetratricopeptide repeat protein [Spirochaeta africana DSM 8902]
MVSIFRSRICFLVLLLIAAVGCASRQPELARDYYNLGVGYLDQGNYSQAREYFARALDIDPGMTRASYNLARAQLLLDQPDQAVRTLQDLLQLDPDNTLVRETLAYAHGAAGDWQEAASVMSAIAEDQRVSLSGWLNYSVTLLELGRYQAAYDAAGRARAIDPEHTRAQVMLVIAAAYTPDLLDDHENDVDAVVQRVPESKAITLRLGEALEHAERYDAALLLYEAAARTHTAEGEVSFRHAELLIVAAEDQERAAAALSQAVSQGFADVERLQQLVTRLEVDVPEAIRDLINSGE